MLDAVYVDAKEDKCIVAVKPKPAFRPIFQVATTREGSGVAIINEPPEITPEARLCFWWRRGRVELPLKHRLDVTLVSYSQPQMPAPALSGLQPLRPSCHRQMFRTLA